MPDQPWLEESLNTEITRIPYVADALKTLSEAQGGVQELGKVFASAGVRTEDPLTVGVFVEVMTRLERQASAERSLILMTMMGTVNHLLEKASRKGKGVGDDGES